MKKKMFQLILSCLFVGMIIGQAHAKTHKIKFATLAPEGTTWMEIMNEMNDELKAETGGDVQFKIYPGGVMGDEKDVVRKIRAGQLHSAGFTGNGLGEILPDIRVMELPFLFDSTDEIDCVIEKLYDDFSDRFEKKGFVLLGWAEVGFVHVFSQKPIQSKKDLDRVKLWTWEGDKLAETTFRNLGVSPIPLSVTDVMTSLQTGLVDAFYASPLGALALQWHTKAKYMSMLRITNASGAVLVSKKMFDKLTTEQQVILKKVCKKHLRRLVESTRRDNDDAIKIIEESGVKLTPEPEDDELENFKNINSEVQKELTGKLFDQEILDKTLENLKNCRENQ